MDNAEASGSGAAGAPSACSQDPALPGNTSLNSACFKQDHLGPALPEVVRQGPSLIISKANPRDRQQVPKRASLPRNPWRSPLGNYIIKTHKSPELPPGKKKKKT